MTQGISSSDALRGRRPRPGWWPTTDGAGEMLERFAQELAEWRARHPAWTERRQMDVFPPNKLHARAAAFTEGPDRRDVYRALCLIAGYLVPAE